MTAKPAYVLDVDTVRQLERLARRWNTSEAAALRRAIRTAAEGALGHRDERLTALDCLQNLVSLDRPLAHEWEDRIRRERLAAAQRSLP